MKEKMVQKKSHVIEDSDRTIHAPPCEGQKKKKTNEVNQKEREREKEREKGRQR